jgi:hypothetical protein
MLIGRVEDTLPNELNDVLNSPEFDDEAGIVIESVNFAEKDISLIFSIRFDSDTSQQFWQLTVSDVEDERIVNEWVESIHVYKEHILLLEYNDNYAELYFNGTTGQSQELFVDIFQSLMKLSGNLSDISKYVLSLEAVSTLSSQGYGLFARGPKTILKVYAACISKYGIKPVFIGEIESSPENKAMKLLKMGNSYVIGHTFEFERME